MLYELHGEIYECVEYGVEAVCGQDTTGESGWGGVKYVRRVGWRWMKNWDREWVGVGRICG